MTRRGGGEVCYFLKSIPENDIHDPITATLPYMRWVASSTHRCPSTNYADCLYEISVNHSLLKISTIYERVTVCFVLIEKKSILDNKKNWRHQLRFWLIS